VRRRVLLRHGREVRALKLRIALRCD
jgi:hypothetical protein